MSFAYPVGWLALALVALAALVVWLYRRTNPPLPTPQKALLGGLRFGALGLVALLLFEPIWTRTQEDEQPPAVAVLVDASQSVGADTVEGARVAREAAREALATLPEGARVELYRFGSSAAPLSADTLNTLAFDEPRTDVAGALAQTRDALARENLAAVVLLSDGRYNTGRNPVFDAERAAQPVYTVVLGDTARQRDVQVAGLVTNELAYVGQELPVDARVRSEGFGGEAVRVTLRVGGEVVDAQQVTLPEGAAETPVRLSHTPDGPGLERLRVEVTALEGEATPRNNAASAAVQVLESRRRVVLVAGAPGPDVGATRRILEADAGSEVEAFVQQRPGTFYGGDLPSDLGEADVLVLLGFPSEATAPAELQQVAAAAEEVPSIFLLNENTDLERLTSAFDASLPVVPEQLRPRLAEATAELTPTGERHPVFEIPGVPADAVERLPPLRASETRWAVAPDARTLLTTVIQGVSMGEPLLVVRQRSGLRSAVLLGGGTWRWTNLPEDLDSTSPLWPGLLTNLVEWAATPSDDRRVRVRPERETFGGGEPVRFTGQVYDERLQPVSNAQVEVDVTGPDGARLPFQMTPAGNGRYRLDAGALPPGAYAYTATATRDGATLGTAQGRFAVGALALEFRETRADVPLLQALAQRTGGQSYFPDDLSGLGDAVARAETFAPETQVQRSDLRLWHRWPVLAAIVLLLSAEWFVRKRSGMP